MPPTLNEDPDGTIRPAQVTSIGGKQMGEKRMNDDQARSHGGQKIAGATLRGAHVDGGDSMNLSGRLMAALRSRMNSRGSSGARPRLKKPASMPLRSSKPPALVMLEILLATTLTLATLTAIVRPKAASDAAPSADQYYAPPVDRGKWDLLASEFNDIGADVRPYNPDRPNLMAVQLRPGVNLTRGAAQKLATCAVSMLSPFALVTLRDSSGKVLALGYGPSLHG